MDNHRKLINFLDKDRLLDLERRITCVMELEFMTVAFVPIFGEIFSGVMAAFLRIYLATVLNAFVINC